METYEELKRKREEEQQLKTRLDNATSSKTFYEATGTTKEDYEEQDRNRRTWEQAQKLIGEYNRAEEAKKNEAIPVGKQPTQTGDKIEDNDLSTANNWTPVDDAIQFANTMETMGQKVISDTANAFGGLKSMSDTITLNNTSSISAQDLLNYNRGERNLQDNVSYIKLRNIANRDDRKDDIDLQNMFNSITNGTYQGNADDIKKTLDRSQQYYQSKFQTYIVEPSNKKYQEMREYNEAMYGKNSLATGIMNDVAGEIVAPVAGAVIGSSVAGPAVGFGVSGVARGNQSMQNKLNYGKSYSEASKDVPIETAKSIALAETFKLLGPVLNSGITPETPTLLRGVRAFINGMVVGEAGSLVYQGLDYLKDDPDFDFIDWEEYEKGVKSGKYKTLQDYTNSEEFEKSVVGSRAKQILITSLITGGFNVASQSARTKQAVQQRNAGQKYDPEPDLKELGLHKGASQEQIEKTFKSLIRKNYMGVPNGTVKDPEILAEYQKIVEAKDRLLKAIQEGTYSGKGYVEPATPTAQYQPDNTPNTGNPYLPAPQSNVPATTQPTTPTPNVASTVTPAVVNTIDNTTQNGTLPTEVKNNGEGVINNTQQPKNGQANNTISNESVQQQEKAIENDRGVGELVEEENANIGGNLKHSEANSGLRISEERLDELIDAETLSPNDKRKDYTKAFITRMTPQQFLDLTAGEHAMKMLEDSVSPLDEKELKRQGQNIYLRIDFNDDKTTGDVITHEGRHRALALMKAGYTGPMDVVVYPYESTYDKYNAHNIGRFTFNTQVSDSGKKVTVDYLDAVTRNNVEYLKNKYTRNQEDNGSIVYEPSYNGSFSLPKNVPNDDLEYELFGEKTAFIDTEEGSKAWKEYRAKEKEQDDIRMQILQELADKGYVEQRVVDGETREFLTEKGKQNQEEVEKLETQFYKAMEKSQELRENFDKLEKAYNQQQRKDWEKQNSKPTEGTNNWFKSNDKNVPIPTKVLGSQNKFLKEFKQVGYIDINGNKIDNIEDFVAVCQIFRDPLAEASRWVFVNDDNIIVGQYAITSDNINSVSWGSIEKIGDELIEFAKRCGSTKCYKMHNHPTGAVEASSKDKKSARFLEQYLHSKKANLKILGDIIIDHNKYTSLKANITKGGKVTLKIKENIKMSEETTNEIEQYFQKDGWTKMRAYDSHTIASLATIVTNNPNCSSLMLMNYHNYPMVLQELPNEFFKLNDREFIEDYIKELAKANGGAFACIATTDADTLEEISARKLTLYDGVYYEVLENGDISIKKSLRHSRKLSSQKELFPYRRWHRFLDPEPDSPKFNLEEARAERDAKAGAVTLTPEEEAHLFRGKPLNKKGTSKKEPTKTPKTKPLNKKVTPEKVLPPQKPVETPKPLNKKPVEAKPNPPKNLTVAKQNKDIEKLTKAVDTYKNKLATQKKKYDDQIEKIKKEYADKLKTNKQKQSLKLKRDIQKRNELQRFRRATPAGKLDIINARIKGEIERYEVANFPELDKDFEKVFGITIRDTIKTLLNRQVYKKLPDKIKKLIDNYADETYLQANWKTFDKYLREALQQEELKTLIEGTDAPVSERLMQLIKEHGQAPIIIKNAGEMKKDLDALLEAVNIAQQALQFKRDNPELNKAIVDARPQLEEIAKQKDLAEQRAGLIKLVNTATGPIADFMKNLSEYPMFLPTRIQMLFNGNPDSAFKVVWDWYLKGAETEMELDVKFARLFDKFVEHSKLHGFTYKGELAKDYGKNPEWIDTGTSAGKLPKSIMMWLAGSMRNTDNLMHIVPVLLGADKQGNPVYSSPGGIVIPDEKLYKEGKIDKAYSKGKTVVLTAKELEKIVGMLTPLEKDFVDACMNVGKLVQQYGNPVSERLTGEKIFGVDEYLRIVVDQDTLSSELIDPENLSDLTNAYSKQTIGIDGVLGRGGSLEARTHRSTRPIYAEDILYAVTRSFKGAVNYIAYAEPIYDTDVLLKSKYPDTYKLDGTTDKDLSKTRPLGITYELVDKLPDYASEKTKYLIQDGDHYNIYSLDKRGETMRKLITNSGDDTFYKYYDNFLRQLLRLNQDKNYLSKALSGLASIRSNVVLHTNLNVAGVQALSYTQILRFLDHPLTSSIKGIVSGRTILHETLKYLNEHGEDVAGLKGRNIMNKFLENVTYLNSFRGLGKYSPDVSYIEAGNTILGRVNSGSLMSFIDRIIVDATFRAIMMDILASGKEFGSEEFMQEFKRRVIAIHMSNPSYLRIFKTPLQTSNRAIAVALSQFQTVMIEGYNNYLQESMAYKYYKKSGNKEEAKKHGKRRLRVAEALAISAGLASIMVETLNELKGKEEDEDFVKRALITMALKLASYTIIGDEILAFALGEDNYDLTTNDLAYFNDVLKSIQYAGEAISTGIPSKWIQATKAILRSVGVPANNIENDLIMLGRMTGSKALKTYQVYKNATIYKKYQKNQDAVDDVAEFYDMYQATRDKKLESDYDWVKGTDAGDYSSKSNAKKRAIRDVLGYPQKKKLTEKQAKEVNKWYEIFKND